MKYFNFVGAAAASILILACFLPWTYYPDLDKTFTGFFSEGNAYGRPGKVFLFLCIPAILFFIIPKIWAKRANMLLGALILAYSIKTYILFTSCYRGDCPGKKLGIYLVLFLPVLIIVATLVSDLKEKTEKNSGVSG
jgi:hypothetical protein